MSFLIEPRGAEPHFVATAGSEEIQTLCVTTIEEIEAAIAELPPEQFERLAEWFDR
jgi:hypothetical protein